MSAAAVKPNVPAATVVWQYPKCSTCRKALKWLDQHGVERQSIDLVQSPPSASQLRDLWRRSGLPLAKMFNTSGASYRAGGFKQKVAAMSESEALAALAADGKLIKRPLIDAGNAVLVGYDETRLAASFGSRLPSVFADCSFAAGPVGP